MADGPASWGASWVMQVGWVLFVFVIMNKQLGCLQRHLIPVSADDV